MSILRIVHIVFAMVLAALHARAGVLEVCADCRYTTVTAAVEAAMPHDTVVVNGGVYFENDIFVNKPLTLQGREGAVIDGSGKGGILVFAADSIALRNVTVRNVGVSYTKDYAAVKLERCNGFVLEGNVLENIFFGFYLETSQNGRIVDNKISGEALSEFSSGNGIHLLQCRNVVIEGNEVFGVRDGIYLEFVDGSRIERNLSYNNIRYGLHFMFSNNDEYLHNTFRNNGAGVAVMFSRYIRMEHNRFERNWGTASYGLLLKEITDAEITDNVFEENTIGINVEGSNRINYRNNRFSSNGWAIYIRGGCYENIVKGNDFLNNTFEISYQGKMNDNEFDGNYWSGYTGYDLDRDGVGDVPYRPVKLFSYVVGKNPSTIVLLRSLFVDLINFSERVTPVFTPDNLRDNFPSMKRFL